MYLYLQLLEKVSKSQGNLACSWDHHFIAPSYPAITWLILDGPEARTLWARHRHNHDFGLKMGIEVAFQASMSSFPDATVALGHAPG